MLFVSQEEQRVSDTVFFTSENNDTANQSVDTSFFTSEKSRMTNQLASLARGDYFYLDAFWRVNLGMYIIRLCTTHCQTRTGTLKQHIVFHNFWDDDSVSRSKPQRIQLVK